MKHKGKEVSNKGPRRPPSLRPETWEFIGRQLSLRSPAIRTHLRGLGYSLRDNASANTVLTVIAAEPGPALVELGITHHPELLRDSVVSLRGGVEYVITSDSAAAIAEEQPKITLRLLGGSEQRSFRLHQVTSAIVRAGCFDQLDPR